MKKLLLFGGTTEGRLLAQRLDESPPDFGWQTTVCVATAYGREVLPPLRRVQVRQGRLNEEALCRLLEQGHFQLVIDATHPYAAQISLLLGRVCAQRGLPLWRCLRPESEEGYTGCLLAPDAAGAARLLAGLPGNILLTTGAKELPAFGGLEKARLFARVLPTVEGVRACEALGLTHSHILALQGPFSQKLNEALFEQYAISVLVTKDGGGPGGFAEKLAAARALGVTPLVIRRPLPEKGLSAEEIFTRLKEEGPCAST